MDNEQKLKFLQENFESFMEFNEKIWLRAAIKGIRPIIEHKINIGEEIDFKGLVIKEKQNLRRWWEKENPLKSTRLSQDYREFLAKLDTLDDLLEQSTRAIEIECRKSTKVRAICETGSLAIVSSILDNAGYSGYWFVRQKYRVKLMVPINNKTLILPLRYKTLQDQIDKIIPAIKDMERIQDDFGKDVKFK